MAPKLRSREPKFMRESKLPSRELRGCDDNKYFQCFIHSSPVKEYPKSEAGRSHDDGTFQVSGFGFQVSKNDMDVIHPAMEKIAKI